MVNLQIEYIKHFPFVDITKEKKFYIRIITTTAKQRSIALNNIIQKI